MDVLTFIEIDVPRCSLTYGTSPCTASIPTTGAIKCFNSLGTCQDRANFDDDPLTLRFSEDTRPSYIDAFPFIKSVDFTPAIVSLGGDLGQRATLKVTFKDVPHSDAGPDFDKYPESRDYTDPYVRGTFWGKGRARHPFLRNRPMRIIRGLYGQALEDMEVSHYVIESIDGPTPGLEFSIVAKDILKLADGDRAQVPVLSPGFLVGEIDADDPAATLSPAGVGDSFYPSSGNATIGGNEVCAFTRSGDVLTLTRGQFNTLAVEHETGDRVQLMYRAAGEGPAVIIHDWLTNYAGVDPEFIDLADWQAETAAFLGVVYTINVAEPTAVNKLISELIEQMGAAIWWDAGTQRIRLQILRAISTTADRYNEDNVIGQSLAVQEQPEKRVSRVIVYFGQINPLKKVDDLDNYRSSVPVFDETSEANEGQALKIIYARGIAAGGRSTATRAGELHLSRYVRPPRRINFSLMRYAGSTPALGQGYRLGGGSPLVPSWPFCDETGQRVDLPIQVTRLNDGADSYAVEAEEMLFTAFGGDIDPTERTVIFDANENSVNFRTRHDELYPEPVDGDEVTFIIQTGVLLGSTGATVRSIVVGDWPSGVTLNLIIQGRAQGAGGNGGTATSVNGGPGQAGGTALHTRVPINVQIDGSIWGGGGGGGASAGLIFLNGVAGAGGAGTIPGAVGPGTGLPPEDLTTVPQPGTSTAGGAGGRVDGDGGSLRSGAGGNPGLAGGAGQSGSGLSGGAGGAAGAAIDGVSYCTITGSGSILGPQIN